MPTLAELKVLREGITPGPWKAGRKDGQSFDVNGSAFTNVYADNPNGEWHMGHPLPFVIAKVLDESGTNKENADLIASAPSILDLAISLLEQREELKRKVEGMTRFTRRGDPRRMVEQAASYNRALSEISALLEDKEK